MDIFEGTEQIQQLVISRASTGITQDGDEGRAGARPSSRLRPLAD
jgi:hypothetical protein